ncbi:MAG: cupin domain-containing protein [Deltaproteobacteria bacterium]
MDAKKIRPQWESRGFSFGIFRDPLGRVWQDFSHSTDELVILAEGQIEIEVEGQMYRPMVREEILSQPWPSLQSVVSERCQMFGTTDID